MLLTVMIPAYNEEPTIEELVELVQKVDLSVLGVKIEIVIVDDLSTDNTWVIMKKLAKVYDNVRIFQHTHNRGKGAGVKTAIKHARGDILIVQDADLEYDPQDYYQCVQPIVDGEFDVVYGSRRLRKENKQYSSLSFYIGGIGITWAYNFLFFRWLTDEPTCYKTFRASVIKDLPIHGEKFDWEPEVTAKLTRMGVKIHEVPISYFPRTEEEGKKIRWKDGVDAILTLLKYRFVK